MPALYSTSAALCCAPNARLGRRSSRLLRESSNSIGNESNVTNNATKHDYEAVLEARAEHKHG